MPGKFAVSMIYRLLLDIQNEKETPAFIRASRPILMKLTGLSENSIKAAIREILALGLVVIASERPRSPLVRFSHQVGIIQADVSKIERGKRTIGGLDQSI